MNIVCAPSGIVSIQNSKGGLMDIAKAGYENVLLDFSLYCTPHELENIGKRDSGINDGRRIKVAEHPEMLYGMVQPMLNQCRDNNIQMQIAYAPYPDRNTKREDLGELLAQLAEESIKACGQAGCRYLITRPLFAGIGRGCEWEINRKYYLGLANPARQNNVMILLENQCRGVNGHLVRGVCADAEEAATWVDRLNTEAGEERFGFCMDAGACNLCGQDMREFAVTLGSRIKAVILRDCDGHHEASMLPFTCVDKGVSQTDWLGLIRGLREIGFDGSLIMDSGSTASAFSSLLHAPLLSLTKAVADYFKWQISMENILKKYDMRVLFGAGNMCRNYMKCYGEKFQPLFTCDNNKSRWGEVFEGLEIKPPEALKELPSGCAVFICNVYYKEIERQLRGMGISNPIEYFNDEYMPSYYFNTLEYWKGEQP